MSTPAFPFDHLMVVHYHWRPGGVRRVVELTLPAIAAAAGDTLKKVTLLSGGTPDEVPELGGLPGEAVFIHEPACDYFSNQQDTPERISEKIRQAISRAMDGRDPARTLIWFQNPALARNAMLCREIFDLSKKTGAALVLHHHDFWCAGRWARWEELERCGYGELSSAAELLFASGARAVHAGINLHDCQTLERFFPNRAFHLPNPVLRPSPSSTADVEAARAWVARELKTDAPLWIYPTRFLRRKNLLEAVLLTRWLRPEAILATTSGQFSFDETGYANDIKEAATRHDWRVHFGLLDKPGAPRVMDLLQIAETVIHTSVQEGFGMAFVETAAVGTPLVARAIPSVMPDLAALGFEFPQVYRDILIPTGLFDAKVEAHRQASLAASARATLPPAFQNIFPMQQFHGDRPVAFSRLSRHAQLEVLSHPPLDSWDMCKPWNPCLEDFSKNTLKATPWPTTPPHSPRRYAEEFLKIASSIPQRPVYCAESARDAQMALTAHALEPESIFPIQLEK
jgi:glycosyltransferase involved in cell wall biosynthesis